MKFKLKFNGKSKSAVIPQALETAKKLGGSAEGVEWDGDIYHIAWSLVRSVMFLKGTELYKESDRITDIPQFISINSCPKKRTCTGLCTLQPEYETAFVQIGCHDTHGYDPIYRAPHIWEDFHNPDLILQRRGGQIVIDKEEFIDQYKKDHEFTGKHCTVFKAEKINESLEDFQERLHLNLNNEPPPLAPEDAIKLESILEDVQHELPEVVDDVIKVFRQEIIDEVTKRIRHIIRRRM